MNIYHPIGLIKKKAAEAFNIPVKSFRINAKNSDEINSDNEDKTFKEYGLANNFFASFIPDYDNDD